MMQVFSRPLELYNMPTKEYSPSTTCIQCGTVKSPPHMVIPIHRFLNLTLGSDLKELRDVDQDIMIALYDYIHRQHNVLMFDQQRKFLSVGYCSVKCCEKWIDEHPADMALILAGLP